MDRGLDMSEGSVVLVHRLYSGVGRRGSGERRRKAAAILGIGIRIGSGVGGIKSSAVAEGRATATDLRLLLPLVLRVETRSYRGHSPPGTVVEGHPVVGIGCLLRVGIKLVGTAGHVAIFIGGGVCRVAIDISIRTTERYTFAAAFVGTSGRACLPTVLRPVHESSMDPPSPQETEL